MDKDDVTHTHTHTHTHTQKDISHKKNEILPFTATRTDLEIFTPSEVSQTKTSIL